jgi:glucose-1-phosphate thymidylyltransferase
MRGIVLAGGAGTRLHPLTLVASKQLQPVYDKPMIYYPIATLMLGGIREVLLISTPHDLPRFEELLGDGSQWGMSFSYVVQPEPKGLAQALILAEEFLDGEPSCLILGDNIFYGRMGVDEIVREFEAGATGATVFGYPVHDPERYGIVELDADGTVISIEEKPAKPKTNLAIPGLYFYDQHAPKYARSLAPSPRGELEITDLNRVYLEQGELRARRLGRGIAWLDSGTNESLLESANFIATVEKRQGLKIACPEEIAWRQGFITAEQLVATAQAMPRSPYRDYCLSLLDN